MRYNELDFNIVYDIEFLLDTYKPKEIERLVKEGDIYKVGIGRYERL